MSGLAAKEKRDILNKLSRLIYAVRDSAFSFISDLTPPDSDARNKLTVIINLFYIYYNEKSDVFMEGDIFYILNLYYRLLLPHVTGRDIPKNIREILHDKLIQTLNTLSQQRIILLNMSVLDGATSQHENLQKELSSYKEEAQRLSNALKDQTEKFNLSSFSNDFNVISKKEHASKIFWLMLAFFFTIGATYFVFTTSFAIINKDFNIPLVEFLQKLTNTLLLYLTAYWCGRRYYICRTQEIIYRHIAAVLNTYSMVMHTTDKEERGIITAEMAHTIFSPPILPSMKAVENSDWAKILEILRLVTGRDGKTGFDKQT